MNNKKNLVLRILSYSILLGLVVFSLSSCPYGGPDYYLVNIFGKRMPIDYSFARVAYLVYTELPYTEFADQTSVRLFESFEAKIRPITEGGGYTFRATMEPEITFEMMSAFARFTETITITTSSDTINHIIADGERESDTTSGYQYVFDASEDDYYFEIKFFDVVDGGYRENDIIFRFYI